MALPNDVSRICDELSKLASSNPDYVGKKKVAARQLDREQFGFEKGAADGSAAAASTYLTTPACRMPRDGRLLGVFFKPHAALTGDNANNAILALQKSDGLGGAGTVMATQTTTVANGNMVAGKFYSIPLSATQANIRFAKGQMVSFDISKGGTGVVVPAGTWIFDIEWEGTDDYEVV